MWKRRGTGPNGGCVRKGNGQISKREHWERKWTEKTE